MPPQDLHGAPFSQNGLDNSGRMSEDPDVHVSSDAS
jgi:hypothetical protein